MDIPRTRLALTLAFAFAAVAPAVAGSIEMPPLDLGPGFGQDAGVPSLAADDATTNLGGLVTNGSSSIVDVADESELPFYGGFISDGAITMSYFPPLSVVEVSSLVSSPEPATAVLVLLSGATLLIAMRRKLRLTCGRSHRPSLGLAPWI